MIVRKITSLELTDITAPELGVQVSISADGKKVWVNVDGVCVLRITEIPELEVDNLHANKEV